MRCLVAVRDANTCFKAFKTTVLFVQGETNSVLTRSVSVRMTEVNVMFELPARLVRNSSGGVMTPKQATEMTSFYNDGTWFLV